MKYIYILLFALVSIGLASCENFRDNNGELGGMWQLTQWRTRSQSGEIDSLVANNLRNDSTVPNVRKIYYGIHRDVFQLRDAKDVNRPRDFFFCTFETGNDYIQLGTVVTESGRDFYDFNNNTLGKLQELEQLNSFGVPANGRFQIDILTSNTLQLSTDNDILIFRKY